MLYKKKQKQKAAHLEATEKYSKLIDHICQLFLKFTSENTINYLKSKTISST